MSNIIVRKSADERGNALIVTGLHLYTASRTADGPITSYVFQFELADGSLSEQFSVNRESIAQVCETIVRAVELAEALDRTL